MLGDKPFSLPLCPPEIPHIGLLAKDFIIVVFKTLISTSQTTRFTSITKTSNLGEIHLFIYLFIYVFWKSYETCTRTVCSQFVFHDVEAYGSYSYRCGLNS